MDNAVIKVEVKAVLPTSGGCAVFLGNHDKIIVIYIDQAVGAAISMLMRDVPRERPQTHDLVGSILLAVGGTVDRIVVNDFSEGVYFARLILSVENELQEEKMVAEIDARPSDCIALATQQNAPIYVSQHVWDDAEDMTEVLRKMESPGFPMDEEED